MKYKQTALRLGAIAGVVAFVGAGAALVPTYASEANTKINANIGSMITISTGTPINFSITPTAAGSASSASDTVKVTTNASSGYKLQLEDDDADNDLVDGSNLIAATSGTFASPDSMDSNSWGYRVDGAGTFGAGPTTAQTNAASLSSDWAAVPKSGSADTLKTTSSVANEDTTTVWYGAFVDSATPNGNYSDTVKYSATVN